MLQSHVTRARSLTPWLCVKMSGLRYGYHQTRLCLQCHRILKTSYTQTRSLYRGKKGSRISAWYVILMVPPMVGTLYVGYKYYQGELPALDLNTKEDDSVELAKAWMVKTYRLLPTRVMSRAWGRVNNIDLPTWMRSPLFNLYSWLFGCKLSEAAIQDLNHYKNLGEFFSRKLKPGCRPIAATHTITSPADGKVLHFGKVENGLVEQVKGVTYRLEDFLGPTTWLDVNNNNIAVTTDMELEDYCRGVKRHDDTALYHCVLYLAPGDYHGFHSPVNWSITYRRHFPGDLLSVSPAIARRIQGLFNFNERAVYYGQWQHGFFAFAAVGATNVGSIKVYCDQKMKTNVSGKVVPGSYYDEILGQPDTSRGILMQKGDAFGEFNLGSTIVLIFEAPKTFEFSLEDDQKIVVGQPVGRYK